MEYFCRDCLVKISDDPKTVDADAHEHYKKHPGKTPGYRTFGDPVKDIPKFIKFRDG